MKSYNSNKIKRCRWTFLRKIWLIGPILAFLFCSCEKDLDVGLPPSQLTGTAIFEDEATVRAALADIYVKLRDESPISGKTTSAQVLLALYADDLDLYRQTFGDIGQFYNHTLLSTNSNVSNFWSQCYKIIYGCNSILEGLENSNSLTQEQKEPFHGEALFVRGYAHYLLTQLFGDIPYITTTDYRVNSKVSRLPQSEVFDKIIADILEARTLLPEEEFTGEHIYPDRGVATAVLAKVYWSTKEWQKLSDACSLILINGTYSLGNGVEDVFLKESLSTIWQLKSVDGNNTNAGQAYIFETGPPPFVALTPDLVNSFEIGDTRRDFWIGEVSNDSQTWYFSFKYQENQATGSSMEYNIVIRLAEIYLMRAEARTHLGLIPEAQEDINAVRQRAGLDNTTAMTESDLLEAMVAERRHEFFAEHGQRWFDLVHTGKAAEVLSNIKPSWKQTDILLPIPQSELSINPNLQPQNPGY